MKVLALDYGSARTGVAVSDPTGTVARPVEIVERVTTEAGFAKLLAVIEAQEPELVVVGLPLTLRGDHGEQAVETAAFTERLRAAIGKEPVLTHHVRPGLIGGAVLRVGDVVADGSVRRRLTELTSRIRLAGDHALAAHPHETPQTP